jgi:hypothetical protein
MGNPRVVGLFGEGTWYLLLTTLIGILDSLGLLWVTIGPIGLVGEVWGIRS